MFKILSLILTYHKIVIQGLMSMSYYNYLYDFDENCFTGKLYKNNNLLVISPEDE